MKFNGPAFAFGCFLSGVLLLAIGEANRPTKPVHPIDNCYQNDGEWKMMQLPTEQLPDGGISIRLQGYCKLRTGQ
jgi:hypothetical protein